VHSLHSVQILKGKEEEVVSFPEYTVWLFKAKSTLTLLHLDYNYTNIGEAKERRLIKICSF